MPTPPTPWLLAYRMSGEERYADQALCLVNAWATSLTDTISGRFHPSSLPLPGPPLRRLLVDPRWTAEEQRTWELFLRDVALPLNCMDRQNNWGNWGLLLVCAVGAYLDDDSLLASGAERWKEFIAAQIAEDGHLTHEVGRNNGTGDHGLWYSHFSLMPQTLAAEILRLRGTRFLRLCRTERPHPADGLRALDPLGPAPGDVPLLPGGCQPARRGTLCVVL